MHYGLRALISEQKPGKLRQEYTSLIVVTQWVCGTQKADCLGFLLTSTLTLASQT